VKGGNTLDEKGDECSLSHGQLENVKQGSGG
jgi:hypothetical protein